MFFYCFVEGARRHDVCVTQIGMIIAVRGRLIANKFTMANYDFKEVIIYGELIEILNKYF